MQVTKKNLTETKVLLSINADRQLLQDTKEQTLKKLSRNVKVPGFREGKAPLSLVEKHLAPSQLQAEFLDITIQRLYIDAATNEKIRPVGQPEIKITKFVPFDTLELSAEVDIIGDLTMPDYKNVAVTKEAVTVTNKDVDKAIKELLYREAEKKDSVKSAGKDDEVLIDFNGIDTKTKLPINGAQGQDYPLRIGSDQFIPGFEGHLIGLKAGEEKTFVLMFPKSYGLKSLQNRKVTFTVKVKKVQKLTLATFDDSFVAKISPFKKTSELKADLKKQLTSERQYQVNRKYENDIIDKLAEATKVAMPQVLIDDQLKDIEDEARRNQTYGGQTWQEYLSNEGLTEETYSKRERPHAELRIKAGLILAEIAEKESVNVTREELEAQLKLLKQQYPDSSMQAELDKPESRQNIFNRILTEKTLKIIIDYNQKH